jgi:hypothetical protein
MTFGSSESPAFHPSNNSCTELLRRVTPRNRPQSAVLIGALPQQQEIADPQVWTVDDTLHFDPLVTITCIASGGVVRSEEDGTPAAEENDMSVALLITFRG